MISYHLFPFSCYCFFLFFFTPLLLLLTLRVETDLPCAYHKKCSDGYQHILPTPRLPQQMQLENRLGSSAMASFFLRLSVVTSPFIISTESVTYFLLLLCLKIYDAFIPYHVSVPVIWLFLSTYLNSDETLQLSSQELLFVELSGFDSFLIYKR